MGLLIALASVVAYIIIGWLMCWLVFANCEDKTF